MGKSDTYLLVIIAILLFASCEKESPIINNYERNVRTEVPVSLRDTLNKADSLHIILYDANGIKTTQINFYNDKAASAGRSELFGVVNYLDFGLDTIAYIDNCSLMLIEDGAERNSHLLSDGHTFLLKLHPDPDSYYDFIKFTLDQAVLSISESYSYFYGATGRAIYPSDYYPRFGNAKSFKIEVFY